MNPLRRNSAMNRPPVTRHLERYSLYRRLLQIDVVFGAFRLEIEAARNLFGSRPLAHVPSLASSLALIARQTHAPESASFTFKCSGVSSLFMTQRDTYAQHTTHFQTLTSLFV